MTEQTKNITIEQLEVEMLESLNEICTTPVDANQFKEWLAVRNFQELYDIWATTGYYKLYAPKLFDQRGGIETKDPLKLFALNIAGWTALTIGKYTKGDGFPIGMYLSIHDAIRYEEQDLSEDLMTEAMNNGGKRIDDNLWVIGTGYISPDADQGTHIFHLSRIGSKAGIAFRGLTPIAEYLGIDKDDIINHLPNLAKDNIDSIGPYRIILLNDSGFGEEV